MGKDEKGQERKGELRGKKEGNEAEGEGYNGHCEDWDSERVNAHSQHGGFVSVLRDDGQGDVMERKRGK